MEWISVKERLPEVGYDGISSDQVLIAYGVADKGIKFAQYNFINNKWIHSDWIYRKQDLVTHWMPLPEPPKVTI